MKKILIVDDQPQIRELVEVTLQIDHYQMLFAENGQQAIEITQTEHPDIILLDVMLFGSKLDGLEVCRRLKKDPVSANIPVILLTAKGQKSEIEAGREAGANDYITKPFSPIALVKKIKALLG